MSVLTTYVRRRRAVLNDNAVSSRKIAADSLSALTSGGPTTTAGILTSPQKRFLLKEMEGVGFPIFSSGMLGGFETTGAPPPMALIGRYNVLILANACCSHSEAKRRVPYDSGQCARRESNSEECREAA